jgi:hypothetical protein
MEETERRYIGGEKEGKRERGNTQEERRRERNRGEQM